MVHISIVSMEKLFVIGGIGEVSGENHFTGTGLTLKVYLFNTSKNFLDDGSSESYIHVRL